MFRKIISNLPFSPALVGQLGFYAKRLRKEETTRKVGLIFVVLALLVQSIAVFEPPQSANASNPGDLVTGGLGIGANRSLNNFLRPYDADVNHVQDIYTYAGITRQEILNTHYGSFVTGSINKSWSHESQFSAAQGQRTIAITNANGVVVDHAQVRPLSLANGTHATIYAYIGQSAKAGWFAIMQICGNLVTTAYPPPPTPPPTKCAYNQSILADNESCKPCPGNPQLWINDSTCIPNVVMNKSAINLSQGGVDGTTVTAQAGDRITYTITLKNAGLAPTTAPITDDLSDVVEYATLIDNGGGTYNETTHILSWPSISLDAGASQTRSFGIQMLDPIPATAQGYSEPTSFDCKINNVFGNAVIINVACPTPKIVEQVTTQLPHTGPSENLLFAGIVLGVATYFYARSRQVKKEIRLIRRDLSSGTI